MQWKKIDNTKRIQNSGVYNDWKQQISNDCYNQCVYCSIHESPWGGIDHYHIDHFKPKSIFAALTNVITNLYYACPICNRFKSDDWPNEPIDLDIICYPDPCNVDYSDLYNIDSNNFVLIGKYVSSKYLINRLYLNRPQLVYERREFHLRNQAEDLINDVKKNIEACNDIELVKTAFNLIANLTQHLHQRASIVPYKLTEIRKN